jgi:hypothetical protein
MSSRQSAQAAIAAMKAARDGKTSRVDQIEVRGGLCLRLRE